VYRFELESLPLEFATHTGLQQAAGIGRARRCGRAVVNLAQFRITTRTILAKEHFGVGLVRFVLEGHNEGR
jgi:hypothetical protein